MYNDIERYVVASLLDLMGLGPRSALDAEVYDITLLEYEGASSELMRSISQRLQSEYPCAVHSTRLPHIPPTPLTEPMRYDVIISNMMQYTPYFHINHMSPLLAANGYIIFNCRMYDLTDEADMIKQGDLRFVMRFDGAFGNICILRKNPERRVR